METEELRRRIMEVLEYDSETGLFRWKVKPHPRCSDGWFAGNLAGPKRKQYRRFEVCGVSYYVHRLAWMMVTGFWPKSQIDHENQNQMDNRFCNLREATPVDNNKNVRMLSNNTSGFNGVYKCSGSKNWTAMIRVNRKLIHLGCYPTKEEAYAARCKANVEYGFHPNHGRPQ